MIARTSFTIDPKKPTVVIQRLFDAPPRLVFEASTKPEYLARWWGFRDSKLIECRVDLRPGGQWRFVLRMPDGSEHGFGGVYREVVPDKRLVYTFKYDGYPDAEAVETVVFEEQRGKTLLTTTVLHTSIENRDGHVSSGMESGATESHERLAELLASMSRQSTSR
jgi:uncharacterized protein YndB with AHSA1/START domain